MVPLVLRRRYIVLWQILFILIGTSWLWAPYLNSQLSYRTTLISQYELPSQPYSWLFRLGDLIAGALLLLISSQFIRRKQRTAGWLLCALSIGLMADPLLSTTCRIVDNTCQEYFSLPFLLHAIETTFTSSIFFILALYDSHVRRKLVSISFAAFQFLYGLLFITRLADRGEFNTAAQYIYQAALIIWVAWYCRELIAPANYETPDRERILIKNLAAAWAFFNGVLAIVISLAHINLLGRIRGLYFSGDSAWLAQHGIAVGVIMLYLSRHLARGEARARQIFILLTGLEALKYAVISPHVGLMLFYLLSFVGLFTMRDDFDRGIIPLTWRLRLKDLCFLISGLLLSALIGLIVLDRDNRVSVITARTLDNFSDYVNERGHLHNHLNSILLAHTISAFLIASGLAVLWILFRPYKTRPQPKNLALTEQMLKEKSNSTEDYFKLWPTDKEYFWAPDNSGFVAYKIVSPIAFALADPITDKPAQLIASFNEWCRQRRLKVCYIPVYPDSLPLYQETALETIQIGSSALVNIDTYLNQTAKNKWWRWRLNKAKKTEYTYRVSHPPHAPALMKELKKISNTWLKIGAHAERGFALGYFSAGYLNKCDIHYLIDRNHKAVAFTNQVPQFNPREVATIDLIRYLPAFNDAMAFLLYKTIENLSSHFKWFDLGFVPFARARGSLLAIAKAFSSDRFSARGLEQFKNKFDPEWQPIYMAYEGDIADLAIIALNIEKLMEHK